MSSQINKLRYPLSGLARRACGALLPVLLLAGCSGREEIPAASAEDIPPGHFRIETAATHSAESRIAVSHSLTWVLTAPEDVWIEVLDGGPVDATGVRLEAGGQARLRITHSFDPAERTVAAGFELETPSGNGATGRNEGRVLAGGRAEFDGEYTLEKADAILEQDVPWRIGTADGEPIVLIVTAPETNPETLKPLYEKAREIGF